MAVLGHDPNSLYEAIRDERVLWINLSNNELNAAIDVAHERADTRTVRLISYQLGWRAGRGIEPLTWR